MAFNNNSRNVANLLRFQPLQPLKPTTQQRINPNNQIPPISRQRQQIPIQAVFTPDDNYSQKRNSRRIAPLSSGNNRNEELLKVTRGNPKNDYQFQTLKTRLDQIIKYYDQRHTNLQSKMMVRLNQLQNFVMKQVPKMDNTIMISSDIVGFKQALKQVRKQQELQFNQINMLKAANRQRNNTESLVAQSSKDKQKMTVLFMELVRLGDTIQKMTDQMNGTTRNYQSKIQDLEQKLVNSQKNLAIISQRTSSGSDVLNQFGDKLMTRLQSAESNLLILGKQQIKNRQVMNNISQQNQRIGEDINTMILNMQTDFQNKLENRMNQTLNRLMAQHQQRLRAQQQIRKNLDMMQRIHQQKQQTDKLQNRARLQNMDAAVRNQFLKKEDSIKALQNMVEQQFRTMISQIQNEGNKRKQQQMAFRFQIKKVQQSFRKQYDLYKNHQSQLIDKMTDLIKSEIQSRTLQQNDLKRITGQVGKLIADDLNNLKQAVSLSNKKINQAIKEVSNQSSERASNLSHYMDKQINKVLQTVTQKYGKMKAVFTKIAQQLRTHLNQQEANKQKIQSRLGALQQDFQKLKTEVNTQIDEFYNDLQARLKQQKQFVETVVFKKTNQLTLRVNKLEQYTNNYFQVLKSGIEDNKELLNNKANNQNNARNEQSEEQIKQLRNIIFDIKVITEEIKNQNIESYKKLDKQIIDLQEKTKETVMELGNNLNNKITNNTEKINQIQNNVNDLTIKVNSIRADSGSQNAISNDRVKKLTDQLDEVHKKSQQIQKRLQEQSSKTDQQLIKLKSDITVLKGEVGALDDDLKKLSSSK